MKNKLKIRNILLIIFFVLIFLTIFKAVYIPKLNNNKIVELNNTIKEKYNSSAKIYFYFTHTGYKIKVSLNNDTNKDKIVQLLQSTLSANDYVNMLHDEFVQKNPNFKYNFFPLVVSLKIYIKSEYTECWTSHEPYNNWYMQENS